MDIVSCLEIEELIHSVLVIVTGERETHGAIQWQQNHYICLIIACYIRVCE